MPFSASSHIGCSCCSEGGSLACNEIEHAERKYLLSGFVFEDRPKTCDHKCSWSESRVELVNSPDSFSLAVVSQLRKAEMLIIIGNGSRQRPVLFSWYMCPTQSIHILVMERGHTLSTTRVAENQIHREGHCQIQQPPKV